MIKAILTVRFLVLIMTLMLSLQALSKDKEDVIINYLDQPEPPSDRPVLFADGIVSLPNQSEEKISFSSDGKEVFFGVPPRENYFQPQLMQATYDGKVWSKPQPAKFTGDSYSAYPLHSPDDSRLFMEKADGKNGAYAEIVYSDKLHGVWSTPKPLNFDVEAKAGFGLAQLTRDNTFYFYARDEQILYSAKYTKGKYGKPEPLPFQINPALEAFVSRDNDYIIFTPIDWSNQMHISFRLKDRWSLPIPFGKAFGRKSGWTARGHGPYVSPDGKYFFFGTGPGGAPNNVKGRQTKWGADIYWIKTDFIDSLRKLAK